MGLVLFEPNKLFNLDNSLLKEAYLKVDLFEQLKVMFNHIFQWAQATWNILKAETEMPPINLVHQSFYDKRLHHLCNICDIKHNTQKTPV